MRKSTIGMGTAVSLWVAIGLLGVPALGQSSSPASPPPPTLAPTPTPDSGIEWPPMGFEGGDPGLLVFTSDCGVWGRDPITLHGEGAAGSADIIVTFDSYDQEAFQWFGRVTGSQTGANGYTSAVDDSALIYYDMDGHWILVAGPAGQIPAHGCAPLPSEPPPSDAPGA